MSLFHVLLLVLIVATKAPIKRDADGNVKTAAEASDDQIPVGSASDALVAVTSDVFPAAPAANELPEHPVETTSNGLPVAAAQAPVAVASDEPPAAPANGIPGLPVEATSIELPVAAMASGGTTTGEQPSRPSGVTVPSAPSEPALGATLLDGHPSLLEATIASMRDLERRLYDVQQLQAALTASLAAGLCSNQQQPGTNTSSSSTPSTNNQNLQPGSSSSSSSGPVSLQIQLHIPQLDSLLNCIQSVGTALKFTSLNAHEASKYASDATRNTVRSTEMLPDLIFESWCIGWRDCEKGKMKGKGKGKDSDDDAADERQRRRCSRRNMKGKEKGKGEDSDVGGDAAAAAGPNVGGPDPATVNDNDNGDAGPNVGGVADDAEALNQLFGGSGDASPPYPSSSPEVLDGDEDESESEPDENDNDSERPGNDRR